MKRAIAGALKRHVPLFIVCLLLAAAGLGVRARSQRAVSPPIYDALNYYQKGAATWRVLREGKLFETLNVEPSFRPPGTVLMSFPFGFDADFHGFLFRSAFFPLLLWSAALGIVIWPLAKTASQRWLGMGLAAALMSLPMFYHYEWRTGYPGEDVWGFQDGFLGALAGLAVALLMTAARNRSYAALAAGTFAGAWTMLVKPSGILLPPVFLWLWGIELLLANWPASAACRSDRGFRRHAVIGLFLQLGLYGGVAAMCFRSAYLSPANIAYGLQAQRIHTEMETGASWWSLVRPQITAALGWHWFIALIALFGCVAFAALARIARGRPRRADIRFFAGAMVMAGGFTWWIKFAAGPDSVRYVYMFLLMPLLAWLPDVLEKARHLPVKWSVVLGLALAAPLALIAIALPMRKGSEKLERLLSINLSAGKYAKEVKMGEFLADKARAARDETVTVYAMPGKDSQFGVLDAVWQFRAASDPSTRPVYFRWPMDWRRSTVVRRSDLLTASYIFFEPPGRKERERILAQTKDVRTYKEEFVVFSAWLGGLGEDDGVRRIMGRETRLLEVTDRQRFRAAYSRLTAEHHWRDVFTKENGETPMEKLGRCFDAAQETALRIEGGANADELQAANQLSIRTAGQDALLWSNGNDPYLNLPTVQLPEGKRSVVRVRIYSPKSTQFQILCFSNDPSRPEPRMLTSEILRGWNDLYFELPRDGAPLKWRMVPGYCEGKFLLRELEVRSFAD